MRYDDDVDFHPCEEGHSFSIPVYEYGQLIGKRCRYCKVFADEFFDDEDEEEEEDTDIADPDEEC